METNSDAQLLRRFVTERSEEAFAELVHRHLGRVYGVALRKVGGDTHMAQDVAQTVFISLAKKAVVLARREVIGGWLYRATHLAAVEALRTRRRRQAREQEAHTMNQSDEFTPNRGELRQLLDEVLHELGDLDRDAVWLRFFEDRAFAQIGERLQVSENAARMRVDRALGKLSALLAKRGITTTAAAVSLALVDQAFGEVPAGFGGRVVAGGISAIGSSTSHGLGGLFMANLKFFGGAALLGGILAASLAVVQRRNSPREAAARSDPTALVRAAELMRRNVAARTKEPVLPTNPQATVAAAPVAPKPAVQLTAQEVPITSTLMQTQIRNNLLQLAAGRNMFLKENGRIPTSLEEIVGPNGHVREIVAVNGEDYSALDFGASRLVVTTADGVEVTLENVAPKTTGLPPLRMETERWEAELAAYLPPAADGTLTFRVQNEYDAALIAIAEVMKREGWDSGIRIFRPERLPPTGAVGMWSAQINHSTDFLLDGKQMRSAVHVQVWISDDGEIVKYEAAKPRVIPLE